MVWEWSDTVRDKFQRLGKPEEIGKTVKWLISEDGDYISGQVIVVDGGFQNSGSRGENF